MVSGEALPSPVGLHLCSLLLLIVAPSVPTFNRITLLVRSNREINKTNTGGCEPRDSGPPVARSSQATETGKRPPGSPTPQMYDLQEVKITARDPEVVTPVREVGLDWCGWSAQAHGLTPEKGQGRQMSLL